ncbi:hypothetical protein [Azospirillum sp. B4]|uniref:hypothetical protein n=1 Tax=Azospirillum sp. B4 TaxID=95605 RepID=UPI00034D23F6|nr:hypothetical protein [Azospirillum sp. B4]
MANSTVGTLRRDELPASLAKGLDAGKATDLYRVEVRRIDPREAEQIERLRQSSQAAINQLDAGLGTEEARESLKAEFRARRGS